MAYAFKKALKHTWTSPTKSNEAVNPLSTNVDVNQSFFSRGFSNKAFGGQKEMEGVLKAIDKQKNPWKYNKKQSSEIATQHQARQEAKAIIDDDNAPDFAKEAARASRKEADERIAKAEELARKDAPGFWNTTGAVAKGTFNAMNAGSAGQVAAKWGTVAGGYMLANGAVRGMTGGGTTYNSTGQRDIMGVPLV